MKKLVLFQDPSPFLMGHSEPWPAWVGFGQQPDIKRGSLDYLSIDCPLRLGKWDLKMSQEDTGFSALKTLKMGAYFGLGGLEIFGHALLFSFAYATRHQSQSNSYYSGDFPAANASLLGLPALSVLRLSGYRPELATEAVFKHHGLRLHGLSLLPFGHENFTLEELEQVAKPCRFSQKLAIRVKR